MVSNTLIIALAYASTAVAHSAIPLVKGDIAGAMTALGYDPDVPAVDPNKNVIEPDANTMPSKKDPTANGLGTLNGKKKVTMDMVNKAVANGGAGGIPKVNKKLQITYREMVLDGRFDPSKGAQVLIDPTATGNFKDAIPATIEQAPEVIRTATVKGTTVVGQDLPMTVTIPDTVHCTGPDSTCLVRIVNGVTEGRNYWGGHVLFQQVPAGSEQPAAPAPGAGNAAGATKKVRDAENLNELIQKLKKIQVREETSEPRGLDNVTEEDMKTFEESN